MTFVRKKATKNSGKAKYHSENQVCKTKEDLQALLEKIIKRRL